MAKPIQFTLSIQTLQVSYYFCLLLIEFVPEAYKQYNRTILNKKKIQ